jgi:hypothetical protein
MTLLERLSMDDVKDLPDWAAASRLNESDNSLIPIITWNSTKIGITTFLDIFGLIDGAEILNKIKSSNISNVEWCLELIQREQFDLSKSAMREQLDQFVDLLILTEDQKEKLLSYSRNSRYPSWSEFYNVHVDARVVGLARGGI